MRSRQQRHPRPSHPDPTFVTIAKRPSVWAGMGKDMQVICVRSQEKFGKSEIDNLWGLATGNRSVRLLPQTERRVVENFERVARMSAARCGKPENQKTRMSLRSSGLRLLDPVSGWSRVGPGRDQWTRGSGGPSLSSAERITSLVFYLAIGRSVLAHEQASHLLPSLRKRTTDPGRGLPSL
jgi:hypothetical protein